MRGKYDIRILLWCTMYILLSVSFNKELERNSLVSTTCWIQYNVFTRVNCQVKQAICQVLFSVLVRELACVSITTVYYWYNQLWNGFHPVSLSAYPLYQCVVRNGIAGQLALEKKVLYFSRTSTSCVVSSWPATTSMIFIVWTCTNSNFGTNKHCQSKGFPKINVHFESGGFAFQNLLQCFGRYNVHKNMAGKSFCRSKTLVCHPFKWWNSLHFFIFYAYHHRYFQKASINTCMYNSWFTCWNETKK